MPGRRPVPVSQSLLRRWPLPDPHQSQSKEDRGRVLVIGGSREIVGAAALSAVAALRVGAGKLQVATVQEAAIGMAMLVPEARVMGLKSDGAGELRLLDAATLDAVSRCDAVVLGPGMACTAAARRMVAQVATAAPGGIVLDAGALVLPKGGSLPERAVLTPHHGEMASLLDVPLEEIAADPQAAASAFARKSGAVVALKSATTVIASPGGEVWVHRGGSVCLGTSGSGDVLAGLIGGLQARGASSEQAAVWGVAMHARAGKVLEQRLGPVGPLAREIADEVPRLLTLR